MKKHDVGAIIFALFVIGSSVVHGFPPEGLTGKPQPFGDCMIYQLGNTLNPFTDFQDLHDESQLAFYPMTNEEVMLYVEFYMDKIVYRVTLEGTTFKLEKCRYSTGACFVEDEGGVRQKDFIKANEWNIVKVLINAQLLQIYVGSRMVKTMSMTEYPNKNNVQWRVKYKHVKTDEETSAKGSDTKGGTKGGAKETDVTYKYLVQFKCKEFVPHDNIPKRTIEPSRPTFERPGRNEPPIYKHPKDEYLTYNPHHRVTTEPYDEAWTGKPEYSKMSKGSYVGLIVGLLIGILLVIVIAIVVYFVIKKRRSVVITEHSRLQDQKAVK